MVSISRIIPFAKTIIGKARPLRGVEKPVSIFSTPKVTNPVDSFRRSSRISVDEVKSFFPEGKIDADNIRDEMVKVKRLLFLSSFKNVERESEAEILMQKASNLLINDAKYDRTKNRWELWAELKQ